MLASTPLGGVETPLASGMARVCWSPSPGNTAAELPGGLSLPPCWDEVDGEQLDGPFPQLTALWLADAADAADAAMAAVEGNTGRISADGGVAWGDDAPLPRPASPSPSSASSSPSARLCKGGPAETAATDILGEGGGMGPTAVHGRRSSIDDASDMGNAGSGRPSSSGTAPVTASATAEAMAMAATTTEALPPPSPQWRPLFDPPTGADADAAAAVAARLAAEVSPLWLSQSAPPPTPPPPPSPAAVAAVAAARPFCPPPPTADTMIAAASAITAAVPTGWAAASQSTREADDRAFASFWSPAATLTVAAPLSLAGLPIAASRAAGAAPGDDETVEMTASAAAAWGPLAPLPPATAPLSNLTGPPSGAATTARASGSGSSGAPLAAVMAASGGGGTGMGSGSGSGGSASHVSPPPPPLVAPMGAGGGAAGGTPPNARAPASAGGSVTALPPHPPGVYRRRRRRLSDTPPNDIPVDSKEWQRVLRNRESARRSNEKRRRVLLAARREQIGRAHV